MSPAESIDGIQKVRNAMHIKNSKSSASYHPDGESRCCIQIIWISNSSGLSRQLLYFRRGKERYFKLDNALAEVLVTLIECYFVYDICFPKTAHSVYRFWDAVYEGANMNLSAPQKKLLPPM